MAAPSPNLTALNKTSAKFASWIVRVTDGDAFQYTWVNKKTGASQTNSKFECRLVGHSESAYVLAVFKGSDKAVALAKEKFKNGSVWILSKIKLDGSDSAYISSPLKISVDLVASNVVSCADLELAKQLAEVSVPPRTVAEATKITNTRHQDLLAIVTDVSSVRQSKIGDVMDVTLMDASEGSPGVFAKVMVSLVGSHKHSLVQVGKALVFFNLACKVDRDSKQYTHWESSLLCEAPSCDKHTKLTADFDKLKNAVNTVMLTKYTPRQSMDVSGPQTIAACAFIDYTAQNPSASLPSVMQIMHATLDEPTGSVILPGTDRIWFTTKLRELSGSAEVGVPERVALYLTGLDRASFIEAQASNTLQFPLLCNVRVSRSVSQPTSGSSGAAQPDGLGVQKTFVNSIIQEAAPVNWNNKVAPNAAYDNVLALLNDLPRNEEGLVFAFLSDIETDPHTGFRIAFTNGNITKGAAVAVLIAASKKSKPPEAIGTGFKIIAPDVTDCANPSAAAAAYHVAGFCTLDDMSKFDLNPPRGHKERFAIAFITSCEETTDPDGGRGVKNFHMDKIQILEQADGPKAILVFQRLRCLQMMLNPSNTDERKHTLTVEASTRPLKQCKTLSAMPSDDSLKDE